MGGGATPSRKGRWCPRALGRGGRRGRTRRKEAELAGEMEWGAAEHGRVRRSDGRLPVGELSVGKMRPARGGALAGSGRHANQSQELSPPLPPLQAPQIRVPGVEGAHAPLRAPAESIDLCRLGALSIMRSVSLSIAHVTLGRVPVTAPAVHGRVWRGEWCSSRPACACCCCVSCACRSCSWAWRRREPSNIALPFVAER